MQEFWFRTREWFADRLYQSPGENLRWIDLTPEITRNSTAIANVIGYVLATYSIVEFVNILYPLQLTNPQWEFQTFGKLVDNIWGLLIGFALIFFRTSVPVRKLELRFLSLLSWLVLGLGIVYFLMVPLATLDVWKLERRATQNYQATLARGQEQVANLRGALQTGDIPPQQLQTIGASLQVARDSEVPLEQQILGALEQRQSQAIQNLDLQRDRFRKNLLRQALKWTIGAILGGFSLCWLWFLAGGLRETLRSS